MQLLPSFLLQLRLRNLLICGLRGINEILALDGIGPPWTSRRRGRRDLKLDSILLLSILCQRTIGLRLHRGGYCGVGKPPLLTKVDAKRR